MPSGTLEQHAARVLLGVVEHPVELQVGRLAAGQDGAVAQPEPQPRARLGPDAVALEQLGADRQRLGRAGLVTGDHRDPDQLGHRADRSRLRPGRRAPAQRDEPQQDQPQQASGVDASASSLSPSGQPGRFAAAL